MTVMFHVFNMNYREESTYDNSNTDHKLWRRERVVTA